MCTVREKKRSDEAKESRELGELKTIQFVSDALRVCVVEMLDQQKQETVGVCAP
jgi:hypothetical protein